MNIISEPVHNHSKQTYGLTPINKTNNFWASTKEQYTNHLDFWNPINKIKIQNFVKYTPLQVDPTNLEAPGKSYN